MVLFVEISAFEVERSYQRSQENFRHLLAFKNDKSY